MRILKRHRQWVSALSVLATAALIGGCEAPQHSADYRENHKIEVVEEVITLSISAPDEGGLVRPSEEAGFVRFTRLYVNRAKGPLTIYVDEAKADGEARSEIIDRVARGLRAAGVPTNHVQVMPGNLGHEGIAPVMMTFDAYQAVAPECGDWSQRSSYNWSNYVHPDYGCSFQRNLALTVSNPGDLLRSQPMSTFDSNRGVVSVVTYRSGGSQFEGSAVSSE